LENMFRAEHTAEDSVDVVNRFHQLYYENYERTWANTRWMGRTIVKCPLDLWIYQEILFQRRPDVIVETGTLAGGSALFLASMCDLLGTGRILTIDIEGGASLPANDMTFASGPGKPRRPEHPRIEYLTGSSVAPEIVRAVRESVAGQRTMVILDSDQSRDHVLAELRAYAPRVTVGDYLIVEDTNINGHPVWPEFGPGPMEAVNDFLAENDSFSVDESREKFFLTQNPRGYLRRDS
jgi:cephalosporin hydroxylase